MKPVNIQIAFQGGGAKLPEILAFAEAVYRMEVAGIIKVSRISGTSAGAISAAILALSLSNNISVKDLTMSAKEKYGKKMIKSLQSPGFCKIILKLIQKKPISDFSIIRMWLDDVFSKYKILTIGDLKKQSNIDLQITKCNLITKKSVICSDDDVIVNALESSSAIPFVFKSWNPKDSFEIFVDGGLASNLPLSFLSNDGNGHTIGVSFENNNFGKIKGIKSFVMAIIETAMNQMENDAKSTIPSNSLYLISSDLSTFDFKDAIEKGLSDHYFNRSVTMAEIWLKNKVSEIDRGNRQGPPHNMWLDDNQTACYVMKNAADIYNIQEFPIKFKILHCKITGEIESLRKQDDLLITQKRLDLVDTTMKIEAVTDPVKSMCFILYSNNQEFYKEVPDVSIFNKNNEVVEFIIMPARFSSKDGEGASRQIIVNFKEPLKVGDGHYTVRCRERVANLTQLKREGTSSDEILFSPLRATGVIDLIELNMMIPKDLLPYAKINGVNNKDLNNFLGSEMKHSSECERDGMSSIGWSIQDIPVEQANNWGCSIFINTPLHDC